MSSQKSGKASRQKEMLQQAVAVQGPAFAWHAQPLASLKFDADNVEIADWLLLVTNEESDWGFGMCFEYLRNVKVFTGIISGLTAFAASCRLIAGTTTLVVKRHKLEPLKQPLRQNQVWSVDFMRDQLSDGRNYRLPNVIDDYRQEDLPLKVV